MPTAPVWIAARIISRRQETLDIVRLELAAVGGSLPAFDAGAHIDVQITDGIVRQYSLCNDPAEAATYQIAILRDPNSRGGSTAAHLAFEAERVIQISAPRNLFPLVDSDAPYILLAGGIGITPILAMAHTLEMRGANFVLHYFARSRNNAAFLGDIETPKLKARAHLHFDDEASNDATRLADIITTAPSNAEFYVCGPSGFINAAQRVGDAAGVTSGRFHYERFSTDVNKAGDSFTVVAQRSNVYVTVREEQSIAEALAGAGVEIPLSCEQGICGTCVTRVLEGIPDHRDDYLTGAEKTLNLLITPCCSRSKTERLVLDL